MALKPQRDGSLPSGPGAERRRLIISATLAVIAEYGVRGTTHRRVAKVAEVPLSTTSYYFGTLERLLEEAFRDAIEHDRCALKARLGDLSPGTDPVPVVARMLHDLIAEPEKGILSHELTVAAVRNDELRALARMWDAFWHEALLPLVGDELTASVAVALTGGILEHGLNSDPPIAIDHIEAMLRRGLGMADGADGRP